MTRISFLACLIFLLSGCVQVTTIPYSARPGDQIVVGLGGIQRNVKSNYDLNITDLAVTITDSSSTTYAAQVMNVFQAYPDYTSELTHWVLNPDNSASSGVVPYDGGWFAVVALTDVNDDPLPLAEGDGTLSVSSASLVNTNTSASDGDLSAIEIEILPPYASGKKQNPQYAAQFSYYTPALTRFAVRIAAEDLSSYGTLGGIKAVINFSGMPDGAQLLGFPASHNPWVQSGSQFVSNGDGTGYIQTHILNPYGFIGDHGKQTARYGDLQIQVLAIDGVYPDPTAYSLDVSNSYVFDIDGNPIAGLALELVKPN